MYILNQLKNIFSNIICLNLSPYGEGSVGRIRYNDGNNDNNNDDDGPVRIRLVGGYTYNNRYKDNINSNESNESAKFSVKLKSGDNLGIKIHLLASILGLKSGEMHGDFWSQVMDHLGNELNSYSVNRNGKIIAGDELSYKDGYIQVTRNGEQVTFVRINAEIADLIEDHLGDNYKVEEKYIEKKYLDNKKYIKTKSSKDLYKLKKEKKEAERLEAERLAAEQKAEVERLEAERLAAEQKVEMERLEAERSAAEQKAEMERLEAERLAAEQKAEMERLEAERLAAEQKSERKKAAKKRVSERISKQKEALKNKKAKRKAAKELAEKKAREEQARKAAKELAEKKAREEQARKAAKELAEKKAREEQARKAAKELAEKKVREEQARKAAKELAEKKVREEQARKAAKELAEKKIREEQVRKAAKELARKEVERLVKKQTEDNDTIVTVGNKPTTKRKDFLERIFNSKIVLNRSDIKILSGNFSDQEKRNMISFMDKDLRIGILEPGTKKRKAIMSSMKRASLATIKNNTDIIFNVKNALNNLKNVPNVSTLKKSFGSHIHRGPLESVALVQSYLKSKGIDIVVDGLPGKQTFAAIKKYHKGLEKTAIKLKLQKDLAKVKVTKAKAAELAKRKIEKKEAKEKIFGKFDLLLEQIIKYTSSNINNIINNKMKKTSSYAKIGGIPKIEEIIPKKKKKKKNVKEIKANKGMKKMFVDKIIRKEQQKKMKLDKSYKQTSKLLSNAMDAYDNKDTLGAIHCTDWIDKIYKKTYGKSIYNFGPIFDGVRKTKYGTGIGVRSYASKNIISKIKPGNHIIVDKPPYRKGRTHSIMALGEVNNGLIDVISYPKYNRPPLIQKYDLYGKGRGDRDGMPIRIQGA